MKMTALDIYAQDCVTSFFSTALGQEPVIKLFCFYWENNETKDWAYF